MIWKKGPVAGLLMGVGMIAPVHAQSFPFADETVTGQFEAGGEETSMTVRRAGFDLDSLIQVEYGKAHRVEFEAIGEHVYLGKCHSEGQSQENLVMEVCDSGNGPNCSMTFVYWDQAKQRLDFFQEDVLFMGDLAEDSSGEDGDPVPYCGWEERLREDMAFDRFMTAHGPSATEGYYDPFTGRAGEEFTMPVTEISPADLAGGLLDLADADAGMLVTHELGGNERWRLFALYRDRTCDGEGLVIAEDRQAGRFTGLYRIPSGCSKALNYPPQVIAVEGDDLIADFCISCDWHGQWGGFSWNLKTHRVRSLGATDLTE